MKKRITSLLILPILLSFCSCEKKSEYTTFKEYVDIVNNATSETKSVFIFTSSSCSHCQKIRPSLEKYKNELNSDDNLNIYELSIDYEYKITGKYAYNDKTMGYLTGEKDNDCLKRLDNRIVDYVNQTNIIPSATEGLEGYYSENYNYTFVVTPLILFYQGNLEVKIINNVEGKLQLDDKGNVIYDSFKELMTFPTKNNNWNKPFDLTYYEK